METAAPLVDSFDLPRREVSFPVTPFDPVTGWKQSSRVKRVFAAASLLTFVSPVLLGGVLGGFPAAVLAAVGMLVGPAGFYFIARMVRPHQRTDGERIARHVLSAASTYWGFLLITGVTVGSYGDVDASGTALDVYNLFSAVTSCSFLAAFTGPVTVVWGLGALLTRTVSYVRTPVSS